MKFDLKNILFGVVIGAIGTTLVFLLIGDINIQTDFQFGEKLDESVNFEENIQMNIRKEIWTYDDDRDIRISIEKSIDENNQEIIIVDAIGKGSATMEDIENELEKVFTEKNIDASSGIIEYNVTLPSPFCPVLDDEINVN